MITISVPSPFDGARRVCCHEEDHKSFVARVMSDPDLRSILNEVDYTLLPTVDLEAVREKAAKYDELCK